MFTDIGKKIKIYARVAFWVASVSGVILGFLLLTDAYGVEEVIPDVVLMIISPLAAWGTTIFMYGLGELIDRVCDLERGLAGISDRRETGAAVQTAWKPLEAKPAKICPGCGARLSEDSVFCTRCGSCVG